MRTDSAPGRPKKKRVWKKRVFTAEQRERRRERQRERRRQPEVRAKKNAWNREWMKGYYRRNRQRVIEMVRSYQVRNIDAVKERRRRHYEENKERILRQQKEYALRNSERLRSRRAEYYRRNQDLIRARVNEYNARHRDLVQEWHRRRAARVVGVPGTFSAEQFRDLVAEHEGRCAYCHRRRPLTADHGIPLSRPELFPTNGIANILPACRPCNSRKGSKTESEFRGWLRRQRRARRTRRATDAT